MPLQASVEAGQPATWAVGAWATGGNVADAKVRLQATPAGSGTPSFSFGCGNSDGTASCDLGAVDASSAVRQLQAQVTISQTALVSAVTLTASVTATGLRTTPQASGSVAVVAAATPVGVTGAGTALPPYSGPAEIPGASLSPGGSASGLFPTIAPSTVAGTPPGAAPPTEGAVPAANTSALSGGSDSVDAQLAGLAALALALFFAVTRVSLRRRRPAPADTESGAPAKEPASDGKASDGKASDGKDGT